MAQSLGHPPHTQSQAFCFWVEEARVPTCPKVLRSMSVCPPPLNTQSPQLLGGARQGSLAGVLEHQLVGVYEC